MAVATLAREAARLLAEARARAAAPTESPLLQRLRTDPAHVLAGLTPDPWQAAALRRPGGRTLFLCSRQSGKSLTAAGLALLAALLSPGALVLLLSPTLRQSGELFRRKVLWLYRRLGRPVPPARLTATELELANGSRVVSLPESEEGIRGFSAVTLLIVDEAARVSDDLYRAVRPMLATSGGRLAALSTPFGKRGWFFDAWENGRGWGRVRVTAPQCPRIPPAFLAEERLALGERWYRQEYECSFEDAVGQVFSEAVIRAAVSSEVEPLALPGVGRG